MEKVRVVDDTNILHIYGVEESGWSMSRGHGRTQVWSYHRGSIPHGIFFNTTSETFFDETRKVLLDER